MNSMPGKFVASLGCAMVLAPSSGAQAQDASAASDSNTNLSDLKRFASGRNPVCGNPGDLIAVMPSLGRTFVLRATDKF